MLTAAEMWLNAGRLNRCTKGEFAVRAKETKTQEGPNGCAVVTNETPVPRVLPSLTTNCKLWGFMCDGRRHLPVPDLRRFTPRRGYFPSAAFLMPSLRKHKLLIETGFKSSAGSPRIKDRPASPSSFSLPRLGRRGGKSHTESA